MSRDQFPVVFHKLLLDEYEVRDFTKVNSFSKVLKMLETGNADIM